MDNNGLGADRALVASDEARSGLHPSGFYHGEREVLITALLETIGRVEHASNMFHNSQQWHEEDAPNGSGTMWDWVFAPAQAALAKARGEA